MNFRILVGEALYTEADDLAEAQSEALDWARELTQACGYPVSVRVYRMGHPVSDALGRDCTPAFWVGSAAGRIECQNAFVAWVPAPAPKRERAHA